MYKMCMKFNEDNVKAIIANYVNEKCNPDTKVKPSDVILHVRRKRVGIGPMEHDVSAFDSAEVTWEVEMNE